MAHEVVIIGGGFGGLYCARHLRRAPVHVTLIDRRNFHLFQPLLYQVATGGLSPGDIAAPLRHVLRNQKNTRVLLGEVTGIDTAGKRVFLGEGEVPYDTLVVAAGSRNHYFGKDAWERYAPGLKTIEDATEIRHRIFFAFEAAERESDPRKRAQWLTFLVVGGGPTGVELAGTLGEIANDTLKGNFRSIRPEEAQILLLEGSPRLLPPYPPDLSKKAERELIGLGVRPRTGVRVTGIDPEGVTLETTNGHERIETRTVLWAAGVKASPLGELIAEQTGAEFDKSGRVIVEPDLTVPGHLEIFVIGDLAHARDIRDKEGTPLPGVAPVAMQEGRYVARAIRDRLAGRAVAPFRYFEKGNLATIGRAAAVAQFGRIHISGLLAWLVWIFVHVLYLVEFQNRVMVLVQWAFQYLTFNRGARLITGRTAERASAGANELLEPEHTRTR